MSGAPALAVERFDLMAHVDEPRRLLYVDRRDQDGVTCGEADAFRLAAARMAIKRQAGRITIVADMLGDRDPDTFDTLDDLIPLLLDEAEYKSYDPAWLERNAFGELTAWMARLTAVDYSAVDMTGCASLSEWCHRIKAQTGDHICHSSGTSGTISVVPRSAMDVDMCVDQLFWNYQPFAPGAQRQVYPHQPNAIQFCNPQPRWQFRIPSAQMDRMESRYQMPPAHMLPVYVGPEQVITQGKLRVGARQGTLDAVLREPIVARYKDIVEEYNAQLPLLMDKWVADLVTVHKGKRIVVSLHFNLAWRLVEILRARGITEAFAPGSIYALVGGNKDGSALPDDWIAQFRAAVGADDDSFSYIWGMSEVNAAMRQCPGGMFHFNPWLIPFLLVPGTREPLPRRGVQTGQFAVMELISEDTWGGMISGDQATIDWDRPCGCGRAGPLMDPQSVGRL